MGTVERRERERNQRRVDIIDAAEKVLFTKGFENTTIDDVAQEVELSKGTLYLYFKNKKEICLAVIIRSLKEVYSIFENIHDKNSKGIDKIYELADEVLNFYKNSPDYIRSLLFYSTHKLDIVSDILQEAIDENEKINNIIADIIRLGIEDGSIRNDIDSMKFSYALWGQLTGLLPALSLSNNDIERTPKYRFSEICRYIFNLIQDTISSND